MMALDVLLDRVPVTLGATIAQAAQAHLRGSWGQEGGVDVLPLTVPSGVWIGMAVPYLGELGLGVEGDRVALRMPAAVAWLVRSRLPVASSLAEGGAMVLLLDLQRGRLAWLDIPGHGRVGVRLVGAGELV